MTRYKDIAEVIRAIGNGDAIIIHNPGEQAARVLPNSDKTSPLSISSNAYPYHGPPLSYPEQPEPPEELTDAQREIAKLKREHLQAKFKHWWAVFGGTKLLVPEHRFDIDGRKWRIDFAIPEVKIGYEVNGGTWQEKGGHNWGPHMTKDYEKWNAATMQGWSMFYFTADMLTQKAAPAVFEPLVHWAYLSLLAEGIEPK